MAGRVSPPSPRRPWDEDIDEADTYGVADNLRQTQAVLNAAVRCFEDNKRFSSSLILGLKRRLINNPGWDGKIKPGMAFDYEWNMLDPAVTTGKGAYDVHPLGFTSFQDRVVRLQAIQQFLGLVLADPELRRLVRLDDTLREVCKALDLDPDQWLKSVQQLQEEAQTQQDVAAVLAAETQQAQTAKLKGLPTATTTRPLWTPWCSLRARARPALAGRQRVQRAHGAAGETPHDMGVDHCRLDALVPKVLLDFTDADTTHQQVRGK